MNYHVNLFGTPRSHHDLICCNAEACKNREKDRQGLGDDAVTLLKKT